MTAIITIISAFFNGVFHGRAPHDRLIREDRALRTGMDDDRIDSMVDDSFPASDPPSTY